MALRLSQPGPAGLADAVAPPQERLRAQAVALLRRGDLKGYRELFARAAVADDPNRRYQARRSLIEAGLNGASYQGAKAATSLFLIIAEVVVELLEQEPREPMILNYAGVALYELGSLQAAEQLFKAARRLDPTLADVARNLDEIARRRRAGSGLARSRCGCASRCRRSAVVPRIAPRARSRPQASR